jgi:CRISPR-associated protein Csm4
LDGPPAADGLVILSTYLPAQNDPATGYWRLRLKLGRLGESAGAGRPFKKPILELEPGAAFRCPDPGRRPWLGRLIDGLAPGLPAAVQNGQALTCPCRWPAEPDD